MAYAFTAGDLALDFVNTLERHDGPAPEEVLTSWADLVDWAARAGVAAPQAAGALRRRSSLHFAAEAASATAAAPAFTPARSSEVTMRSPPDRPAVTSLPGGGGNSIRPLRIASA